MYISRIFVLHEPGVGSEPPANAIRLLPLPWVVSFVAEAFPDGRVIAIVDCEATPIKQATAHDHRTRNYWTHR